VSLQVVFNKQWGEMFWNVIEEVGFYNCWFFYSLIGILVLFSQVSFDVMQVSFGVLHISFVMNEVMFYNC
jgi:hypothetical protein